MSDLRATLAGLTPERRAELLARLSASVSTPSAPVLAARPRGGPVPVSFAQRTLWFLDRLAPGQATYHTGMTLTMTGPLDVEALQRAFATVVERHEGLRTRFEEGTDGPTQSVMSNVDSRLPITEPFDVREFTRQAFDLEIGPLWRARLIREAPDRHVLVLVVHHIIIDGWSLGIIVSELAALYRGEHLDPVPLHYIDYSEWQREWLAGPRRDELVKYWREKLDGVPISEFPTDRPRPAQINYEGGRREHTFPANARLDELVKAERTTPFAVYMTAFLILMHRYTGLDDLAVGVPSANRGELETESIVGFFANMLVMRTDLSGDPTARELMQRVRETALDAFAHGELPFERLVDALRPPRDPSRSPLFQVGFTAEGESTPPGFAGLKVEQRFVDPATSRFDLSWWATAKPGELHVGVEYNSTLFDPESVDQFIRHYGAVLTEVLSDPDRPISTLPLLSADERQELITRWNGHALPIPRISVPAMFSERVRQAPDSVALVVDGREYSYAELDRRANRLANALRAKGAGVGQLVALCLPREVDLIASVLAVLKTGAAYVPIDPTLPAARRMAILDDAQPVVQLDEMPQDLESFSDEDVACPAGPDDVAYVMYTSGTTGQPKGVLIEHHSIIGFVLASQELFDLTEADRILGYASPTFDVFVGEVFNALLLGGRLCLAQDEDRLSIPRLQRLLESARVTWTDLPPAVMALLEPERMPALRNVFVGGELFPGELVNRWNRGRHFFNGYGPTECTVTMVVHDCLGRWDSSPPIGLPIANHAAHVVDRHMEPMPYGVPGELVIGGEGLTRGYLNAPDLTAQKIVEDPFGSTSDGRLYHTGDLVKRQRDGSIMFIGRIDQQVKIRGMRIELGDIEAAIASHTGVDQVAAVVWADERGEKHLVAYVVASVDVAQLRAHVAELLPRYMSPAYWVRLETMPLTVSGKTDRRRLPAPAVERVTEIVAPSTETERVLAEDILAALLRLDRIGVTEDFFELGGNSLQAAQLMWRITQAFEVEVRLADFFQSPTVAHLAGVIDRLRSSDVDDEADAVLAEIEQMSEEEAARLLESERQRS